MSLHLHSAPVKVAEEISVRRCRYRQGYPLPEAQHASPLRQITAVADNMEAVAVLLLSDAHPGYLPEHFAEPYVEVYYGHSNPQQLCYSEPFHVVARREQQRGEILSAFMEDLSRE